MRVGGGGRLRGGASGSDPKPGWSGEMGARLWLGSGGHRARARAVGLGKAGLSSQRPSEGGGLGSHARRRGDGSGALGNTGK